MRVSGAGVNLGVGNLNLKNTECMDMDPDLDIGTGIRYTTIEIHVSFIEIYVLPPSHFIVHVSFFGRLKKLSNIS